MLRVSLALVLVLLVGCPTVSGPGAWPIHASGEYRHEPSGFVFPEAFGTFRRVAINRYDEGGLNIGVGYNLDTDVKMAVTLYIRPSPLDDSGTPIPLARWFDIERDVVTRYHADASLRAQFSPQQTQNGESGAGHAIAFRYTESFAGARRPVTSLLYLFQDGDWVIKYRITFATAQEEKAWLLGQVFVNGFKWRGAG